MQHVLDIDLDFFLADCCPLAPLGKRPTLYGHEPYSPDVVRSFLENNCGVTQRIPGRVFETHDKALFFWQELIQAGELTVPFAVTHIDAHSDLGIGYPGPGFVLNTVISTRLDKRCNIQKYTDMHELDEANYLLFAIGMRYVAELENVRNPRSREDIPREIIRTDENGERSGIRLASFASVLMEGINGSEPYVKYREYRDYTKYTAEHTFDFASLAISPRYAPEAADALVNVIAEKFDLI